MQYDKIPCCHLQLKIYYLYIKVKSTSVDKTKYVADWTTKHSLSPRQDAASQVRRKLPASPGSSSPDNFVADSIESMNVSQRVFSYSDLNSKSNARHSDGHKTTARQTRSSTDQPLQSAKSNLSRQQTINSNSSSSGSAPDSARSGSSESSGYHSRQDVGRWSTRKKPGPSTSLSKAPSRSNSSLTAHEAEFQAWKKRKDYKPTKSSSRYCKVL